MPYQRPELIELRDNAYAAIEALVPGADARLRFTVLNALAIMTAGAVDGLYGHQEWISQQLLPDTAEAEFLDRHASLWLPAGRKPAVGASGPFLVAGVDGTTLPAGTLFIRSDGVQYAAAADGTVAGGSATVELAATTSGASTNATMGQTLTLVSPVPGLQSSGAVGAGGLTGGTDIESDEQLRARIVKRIQRPPDGGSLTDYEQWALEVPGVTRAWVAPLELGAGTVVIRFVRDGDVSIIPDAAAVAAVQAHIDAMRPVTADAVAVAPIELPVDYVIQLTPNTAAVRAAVEAELRDLHAREAVPSGTLLITHIREAISIAAGEVDHVLTSPTANVVAAVGELPTFGSVSWT